MINRGLDGGNGAGVKKVYGSGGAALFSRQGPLRALSERISLGDGRFRDGAVGPLSHAHLEKRRSTVPDLAYVLLTVALFAVLVLAVRGAEKL